MQGQAYQLKDINGKRRPKKEMNENDCVCLYKRKFNSQHLKNLTMLHDLQNYDYICEIYWKYLNKR